LTGYSGAGRIKWQENVLNRTVLSKDGTGLGIVAHEIFREELKAVFTIDPNSKEIGLMVGVSIQAFHLEITILGAK